MSEHRSPDIPDTYVGNQQNEAHPGGQMVDVRTDGNTEHYHTGRCDMLGDPRNTPTTYTKVPLWLAQRAGLKLCGKCPTIS